MKQTIDELLSQRNLELKSANIGIVIQRDGNSLYLRGMFPPKPKSDRTRPSQQRIALKPLGIRANHFGIGEAKKEAQLVGGMLARNEFSWERYLSPEKIAPNIVTVAEMVEQFRVYYFNKGGKETTWKGDYWKIYKRIPQDASLSVEVLESVILSTQPNSKTRKRACMAIKALANHAGLDYNPARLAGNYSPKSVNDRYIPDDSIIIEWFNRITNPGWKWVYGILACYGLRPHEAFRLDFDKIRDGCEILSVLKETKTGARQVWPYFPELFSQFNWQHVQLPNVKLNRSNEAVGASVSEYFGDFGFPFVPYALRDRWAIRALEFGLDITLRAKQMGHTVGEHQRSYLKWIDAMDHQRAYETVMKRLHHSNLDDINSN